MEEKVREKMCVRFWTASVVEFSVRGIGSEMDSMLMMERLVRS